MKKIMFIMYALFFGVVSIFLFLDYSNMNTKRIEDNIVSIQIEKPDGMSNKEFLVIIESVSEKSNIDILYKKYQTTESSNITQYYITNNSNHFIDQKYNEAFDKGETISTLSNNSSLLLNGTNLFGDIEMIPFERISKYNINKSQYYVKTENLEHIQELLYDIGLNVSTINEVHSIINYLSIQNMLIPIFLLVSSIIYYYLSLKKQIMIKKMNGFSNFDLIKEEFIQNFSAFMTILAVLSIIKYSIIFISFRSIVFDFFKYEFILMLKFMLSILLVSLLCNITIVQYLKYDYIKGKNSKDIFVLTILMQIIFSFICTANMSILTGSISKTYSIFKGYSTLSDEMKNYVSLPINTSNTYMGDDNQLEYNTILAEFYKATVDKYNGILIESNNYKSIRNEQTMAELYNQEDITININYLKKNPIYDINHKLIEIDKNSNYILTILAPEKYTHADIKEYYEAYHLTKEQVNIIFYEENTNLPSYNSYSGTNGYIKDPIIYLYEDSLFWNLMLNYISGEYYLLNIPGADPYNEILPILTRYGIESIIPNTPYLSNTYDESLAYIQSELIWHLSKLTISILGILCIIIYCIVLYFTLFKKEIAIKKLSGYPYIFLHQKLFLIHLFSIFCLIIGVFMNFFHIREALLMIVIQSGLTFYISKRYERKNIVQILKGEH